jgi:enoyl-CoA hydratase
MVIATRFHEAGTRPVQYDAIRADKAAGEAAEELAIEVKGSLAIITLNRPRALNALNAAMRRKLAEAYPRFARDAQIYAVVTESASEMVFSAGGDVRELVRLGRDDRGDARRVFAEEYALDWLHECFSKPTISLIDGPVMGSGVGITLYGTHRIAGERYRFAMPETAIGLFPDVGAAHALSRMPGAIGMYLGLTGRSLGAADAYALGLVTHCIASARYEEIKAALVDTWPVDPLLDARHRDPGPSELEPYAGLIARCFSAPTVEEIVARLGQVDGPARAWAQGSPTISRPARLRRSRSRTGTSATLAPATCARPCRSTTGSPAGSSRDTTSMKACGRR